MKIGFYFECSKKSGGVYQYALNLLETLKKIGGHSYVVFNISPDFPFEDFKLPNWKIINLIPVEKYATTEEAEKKIDKAPLSRKLRLSIIGTLRKLHLYRLEILLTTISAKKRANRFDGNSIDLMFFHGPSELSFLTKIPSVVPIHDIQHKVAPRFPELIAQGQYQKREYLYNHIKKSAYKILVDSQVSKEDITTHYHIGPERITITPYLPPSYLKKDIAQKDIDDVIKKYNLPIKFLFYPAQMWPHKNHQNLVRALKILKGRGLIVPVVFVGSKQDIWGEYDRVMKLIGECGLTGQVKILGYVPNLDLNVIYKIGYALVMPQYSEPSNIPIVEAWHMDCPVIYSDARGCREQAGDAALLADPEKPESIAEQIELLWSNDRLRSDLIEKGRKRLLLWTPEHYHKAIEGIINEFEQQNASHRKDRA